MRISDWSSDVCSSDLGSAYPNPHQCAANLYLAGHRFGDPVLAGPFRRGQHPQLGGLDDRRVPLAGDGAGAQADPSLHAQYRRHRHIAYRSEEHTSELQSLMRISYAVFCLKKKIKITQMTHTHIQK